MMTSGSDPFNPNKKDFTPTKGSALKIVAISGEDARNLFFQDPKTDPGEIWGTLYLLRRDIKRCLTQTPPIYWPSAMAILTGIDLLGKFYAGKDEQNGVTQRFKNFITEYFQPISLDEVEIIYQLRNALLHSSGLYSKFKDKVKNKTVEYFFAIFGQNVGISAKEISNNKYLITISIEDLNEKFETAVESYYTKLKGDKILQENFKKMFPNYGLIWPVEISVQSP